MCFGAGRRYARPLHACGITQPHRTGPDWSLTFSITPSALVLSRASTSTMTAGSGAPWSRPAGGLPRGPLGLPTGRTQRVTSRSLTWITSVDREVAFEAALAELPPELQEADPNTYPNYEEELKAHLSNSKSTPPGEVSPQFNFAACAAAVAPLIIEYGIPVWKVIGWIRRARQIWGGVRGIWTAIRSGAAAAEIGEDAVKVLEGILGVGGVVSACSI